MVGRRAVEGGQDSGTAMLTHASPFTKPSSLEVSQVAR
jgi:hypothetical protein